MYKFTALIILGTLSFVLGQDRETVKSFASEAHRMVDNLHSRVLEKSSDGSEMGFEAQRHLMNVVTELSNQIQVQTARDLKEGNISASEAGTLVCSTYFHLAGLFKDFKQTHAVDSAWQMAIQYSKDTIQGLHFMESRAWDLWRSEQFEMADEIFQEVFNHPFFLAPNSANKAKDVSTCRAAAINALEWGDARKAAEYFGRYFDLLLEYPAFVEKRTTQDLDNYEEILKKTGTPVDRDTLTNYRVKIQESQERFFSGRSAEDISLVQHSYYNRYEAQALRDEGKVQIGINYQNLHSVNDK